MHLIKLAKQIERERTIADRSFLSIRQSLEEIRKKLQSLVISRNEFHTLQKKYDEDIDHYHEKLKTPSISASERNSIDNIIEQIKSTPLSDIQYVGMYKKQIRYSHNGVVFYVEEDNEDYTEYGRHAEFNRSMREHDHFRFESEQKNSAQTENTIGNVAPSLPEDDSRGYVGCKYKHSVCYSYYKFSGSWEKERVHEFDSLDDFNDLSLYRRLKYCDSLKKDGSDAKEIENVYNSVFKKNYLLIDDKIIIISNRIDSDNLTLGLLMRALADTTINAIPYLFSIKSNCETLENRIITLIQDSTLNIPPATNFVKYRSSSTSIMQSTRTNYPTLAPSNTEEKTQAYPRSSSVPFSRMKKIKEMAKSVVENLKLQGERCADYLCIDFDAKQSVQHIMTNAVDVIHMIRESNASGDIVFLHCTSQKKLGLSTWETLSTLLSADLMHDRRFLHINNDKFDELKELSKLKEKLKEKVDTLKKQIQSGIKKLERSRDSVATIIEKISSNKYNAIDYSKVRVYIPICIGHKPLSNHTLTIPVNTYDKLGCKEIAVFEAKHNPIDIYNTDELTFSSDDEKEADRCERTEVAEWRKQNNRFLEEKKGIKIKLSSFNSSKWMDQPHYFNEAQIYFDNLLDNECLTDAIINEAVDFIAAHYRKHPKPTYTRSTYTFLEEKEEKAHHTQVIEEKCPSEFEQTRLA